MKSSKFDEHYNSIDLCKFIMAYAVIVIHVWPLDKLYKYNFIRIYNLLIELVVPFFFLASGYLLAVRMNYPYGNESNLLKIRKQLKRIVQMYLTWNAIYLPLAIYHFISTRTPLKKAVFLYIRGFFFIGEQYNSWPLWYLLSTIYALIVIWLVLKIKKTTSALLCISIVSSIVSVGTTMLVNYRGGVLPIIGLLQKSIKYSIANGRIFNGMIYIPIGMLLSYKKTPKALSGMTFVVCIVVNYFTVNSIISSYLSIFTAIALFEIVEVIDLKDNEWYAQLRIMSTTIYLTHMYIWTFYYKIIYGEKTYSVDSFLATAVIATVIAIVYSTIVKCKMTSTANNKFLIQEHHYKH